MSDINFTVTERGYEITEVNKYITMIQQEYANAVAWGEEMERKYEELKKSVDEYGLFFTISEENQKLTARLVRLLTLPIFRQEKSNAKQWKIP